MSKGNIALQRQRYRMRYRGCRVCGEPGDQKRCADCWAVSGLIGFASHLIVDGSFLSITGERTDSGQGYGGAGLVLVGAHGVVLASRSCGFGATSSSDAEEHAIVRGGRWAPGLRIYTDAENTAGRLRISNPKIDVRFLDRSDRGEAYRLAHRLSVEGRCRFAAREREL